MESDDFFESFRNKDLSKVKRFDYKKYKESKLRDTLETNRGPLNAANPVKTLNGARDGFIEELGSFKRINNSSDTSSNKFTPVCKELKAPTTIPLISFKYGHSDSFLDSLYKSTNVNDASSVQSTISNQLQHKGSPSLLTGRSKCTVDNLRKSPMNGDMTTSLTTQHKGSPSLFTGRAKCTVDNLCKSTTNDNMITSLSTQHKDIPSLLTGRPKCSVYNSCKSSMNDNVTTSQSTGRNPNLDLQSEDNPKGILSISKYFNNERGNENPEINGFKKQVQSSTTVKPKKFVFKKIPWSSISEDNNLDERLASHCDTSQSKDFSVNLTLPIENTLSNTDDSHIPDLKELSVNSTQPTKANEGDSQSLEITDDDYMDDEEFERRFGHLAEQTSVDNTDILSTSKAHIDHQDTAELLNEISTINWDEDVFQEEPAQEGFKDREDNSEEFRGSYEHSSVMLEVLHQKFGLRNFRPHQREIINASLIQHDCFVLMPTGGGKSLCYQLPATLMPGVTIVISPLRALICDQVDKLNALDIAAAHLCSDVSKVDSEQIYMKLSMREPALKLLYLTPEKISASRVTIDMLNSLYQRGKLARFVIDEVHCLSQWGHDFRPDYKQLGLLRQNYKDVPIICLTATATKQVENDVVNILRLRTVKRFIRSFNRPNIKYQVVEKTRTAKDTIAQLVKDKFPKQSGIVYCLSRKDCEKLADDFNELGVKAKPYHAGMADKVREVIQREWMQDRFHVIVATIAFGMGIDKPDVRFVIHNSIPKSVEAFYQESGRAGRDGEVSYSYLFYWYKDVSRLQKVMRMDSSVTKKTMEAHDENLKQMVSFAENLVDCRRYLQLIHLGEHFDRRICIRNKATTCDNCENIDKYKSLEVTKEAKEMCQLVKDLSEKESVTMVHVADVYRGAKLKKILDRRHNLHPLYGRGASMDRNNVHRVLKELILKYVLQDFLTYTGDFPVVYIRPGPKFYQFYNSDLQLTIPFSVEMGQKKPVVVNISEAKPSTSKVVPHSVQKQHTAKLQAARKLQLSQIKVQCHEELLEECRRLAMERNLTLSSVMNLSAIKSMSDHLPSSREEMLKIQHVTQANYNKYGEFFLIITQKFRQKYDVLQPLAELPDEDFQPSDSSSQNLSQSNRGGVKRKGTWGPRKGGYKKKKSNYRKKKGKSSTSTVGKSTCSGWKGKGKKGGGGGSGLGLMPIHIK